MSFSSERGGYNPERTEALAAATFEELLTAVEGKLRSGEALSEETRARLQRILQYKNALAVNRGMENESVETLPEEVRQIVNEINKQLYGGNNKEREAFFDKYGSNRVDISNAIQMRTSKSTQPELQDSGPGGLLRINLNNKTYLVPFSPQHITKPTARYLSKDIYDFQGDSNNTYKEYEKIELVEPAQITQSGGKNWSVTKKGKIRLY